MHHVALLLHLAVSTGAFPQQASRPYNSSGASTRACSGARFTLEVPLSAPAFRTDFEAAFTSALPMNRNWFCPGCPMVTLYRVKLTPVLAARPGTITERHDGHRRSFLVTFEKRLLFPSTSPWKPAEPIESASCEVVKAIRTAAAFGQGIVEPLASSPLPQVLVSRSCDVLVQDAEAHVPLETLDWSSTRIEARPSSAPSNVRVALIDTGVHPSLRTTEQALPSFELPEDAGVHPHGTQMAALILKVAPKAELRSYRALDGRGMGSMSSLARATDDALFDGRQGPLVVNLSVGAPPDFLLPARLTGANCETWEDGVGETLRYVLKVATTLDRIGPAVFVTAASGNMPFERVSADDSRWTLPAPTTACETATVSRTSSFAPAAMGELPTCVGVNKQWLGVQPVGATDFADRASGLNLLSANLRLFAPGERVYATNSAMPPSVPWASCDDVSPSTFALPVAISGTSVSSALTAAAAAHLLARQPWSGLQMAPRAAQVSRLLYLTGQRMCGVVGSRPRRISVARAEAAITNSSSSCRAFIDCLSSPSHPVGPALSDMTGALCDASRAACLGEDKMLDCPVARSEPGWAQSQMHAAAAAPSLCREAWNAPNAPQTAPPLNARSKFTTMQMGGLGPQPSDTGCPDCGIVIGGGALRVRFELNDNFLRGTTFTDPWVVIMRRDKEPVAWIPVSNGTVWMPGSVGIMRLDFRGYDTDFVNYVTEALHSGEFWAVLDLAEVPIRGEPSRNVSVLRVETTN